MMPRMAVAARLDRIAYGATSGQSYSQTKARLDRLADLVADDPNLALRIRSMILSYGASLGDRYAAITRLAKEVREQATRFGDRQD